MHLQMNGSKWLALQNDKTKDPHLSYSTIFFIFYILNKILIIIIIIIIIIIQLQTHYFCYKMTKKSFW